MLVEEAEQPLPLAGPPRGQQRFELVPRLVRPRRFPIHRQVILGVGLVKLLEYRNIRGVNFECAKRSRGENWAVIETAHRLRHRSSFLPAGQDRSFAFSRNWDNTYR